MKKTIMYLIAIALVIILGIAVAKNMLKENEVEPKNIVDVNKEKEVNILDEEIKQEEIQMLTLNYTQYQYKEKKQN